MSEPDREVPVAIVASRWDPFRAAPYVKGSRMDWRCTRCLRRVVVAPSTVEMITAYPLAPVVCLTCMTQWLAPSVAN